LHIACMALGLKKGEIVWTSSISFVASANCALYCGAKINFVDIDLNTLNIDPDELERKLIIAKKEKRLPKIVIPVHMAGMPCDMPKIFSLSKKYGFKIIEDASHALGAKFKNKKVGSCKYSDVTVFSFHPVKTITTGEGGAATTNKKNLRIKMNILKSHGINKDVKFFKKRKPGEWHYEQLFLGYNYRMSDISAAMGISQIKKIDKFVEKRNIIANKYYESLSDLPIKLQLFDQKKYYSSFHLFIIQLELDNLKNTHKKIFSLLRRSGIGVNLHYAPIHLQPYYKKLGFKKGDFKNAEKYATRAISIPVHPKLSHNQFKYVLEQLKRIIK